MSKLEKRDSKNIYILGGEIQENKPLFIVDGKEVDQIYIDSLSSENVESFSILNIKVPLKNMAKRAKTG